MIGWPVVHRALPNQSHNEILRLEQRGRVTRLVTQNVDGLHQKAGSTDPLELHGSISSVVCQSCRFELTRLAMQELLFALNPTIAADHSDVLSAPDGDALQDQNDYSHFHVPDCPHCASGILKPNVVFFGDWVPKRIVDSAFDALNESNAVLVLGSSLSVFSGFRFVERAHREGKPIASINLGFSRGEDLFNVKVQGSVASVLSELNTKLS